MSTTELTNDRIITNIEKKANFNLDVSEKYQQQIRKYKISSQEKYMT